MNDIISSQDFDKIIDAVEKSNDDDYTLELCKKCNNLKRKNRLTKEFYCEVCEKEKRSDFHKR